jgi:soluble lytic murein transglycosylase-like protein
VLIDHFEKKYNIPEKLLWAIARVESKEKPWAVYAKGRSHFFSSREAAVSYVEKLKANKVKNINVGCMQINLQSHGKRFKNLTDAFTPYHNIEYGAKLMRRLYDQHGSWEEAVRYYHSALSIYNVSYKHRVYSHWAHARGETYTASYNEDSQENAQDSSQKAPFFKVGFGPGVGVSSRAKA